MNLPQISRACGSPGGSNASQIDDIVKGLDAEYVWRLPKNRQCRWAQNGPVDGRENGIERVSEIASEKDIGITLTYSETTSRTISAQLGSQKL